MVIKGTGLKQSFETRVALLGSLNGSSFYGVYACYYTFLYYNTVISWVIGFGHVSPGQIPF